MSDINIAGFTDVLEDEIGNSQESQPLSLSSEDSQLYNHVINSEALNVQRIEYNTQSIARPDKGTGQYGQFRSVDEIDVKYRSVFSYPFFNLVQSGVIDDALYSDKSMVVCAPTGSGKTVVFEMAIVQLLMEIDDKRCTDDFKIIYMAPVKALCTERLTEWYPKFTKLGLMCIEVTGDTDVDFSQLEPYRIIITTPEKWDMVTRRWREHRQLVEVIKLFLIDEVHILNDETRGPVLEAVVSRMKTIEVHIVGVKSSAQSAHRIEQLQKQYQGTETTCRESPPRIRFVAVSATVSNPDDVAAWLGTAEKPAVYYKFGDESRPVKLKRVVEGYPCPEGTSIFKFDIILNYKLWPVIQKYHNGKPTLIFCNTRKSVALTAETLSKELTVSVSPEQKAKLTALASTIKNKKLQALVLSGVGCHHAGLLYEERNNIEKAFRNRDLPILITTTTLAMGVNLPAHLVIIKNTQQYVNGAYQEYSISTVLQMIGRAGRPQYDTEATAVIMTRLCDKPRYQALVGGSEPLQSYLHKRLPENLNSEAALGTVNDVAQCVQWLHSTFLCVRASRDPKRYLGLPAAAPQQLISKKIEELCVKAMNGLATSGLITMDEASCIESTEAGRLMSIYYLDLETMKHIMKINGTESLERLLWVICESHELADMHLRVDERRCLNTLNRNNTGATIRFPMKGKISTRQMKLNCIIQAILGCLNIPEPSLNQEAMKIMRIADRVCKCLVAYVTRPALVAQQPQYYSAVLNSLILAKCVAAHLWENSPFVSRQLKGIGPTFSTLLATAGKVNFMLLEESHPRDLERIMNKGPPAGNVLRKQVSLLPKYQLTMTPVDEKSVAIQLVLINQNYLSENMENLTAGNTHKTYVVIGDSENNLLLLMSFKDKDLISIYDGTITHQITRKHSFEHKMFAHCVSSSFVGVDAQCEYLFKDLEAIYSSPHLSTSVDIIRKSANKQTVITDTFKERRRKSTSENDVTQSKEKKKRDSALFEKLKYLKESFGKKSKEMKDDLDKSVVMSNQILRELTQLEKPTRCTEIVPVKTNENFRIEPLTNSSDFDISSIQINNTEVVDCDVSMNDEKINSILSEIECEISKGNFNSDLPRVDLGVKKNTQNMQNSLVTVPCSLNSNQRNKILGCERSKIKSKKKGVQKKTNYNFVDLLEKNVNLSDEDENPEPNDTSGFSETIKNQIEKYLHSTKVISKVTDRPLKELLQVDDDNEISRKEQKSVSDSNLETITDILDTESNKHNDTIHASQNIKKVKKSYLANKNKENMKSLIESENYDTNLFSESMNGNNNTMETDPNSCSLDLNTNRDIKKLLPTQNESQGYVEVIDQNENTFKPQNLVSYDTSTLFSDNNKNVNIQFKERLHDFYARTTEPNSITYPSTSFLELPHTLFNTLTCLKNHTAQYNQKNMMDPGIDTKKSNSRLIQNENSKLEPFVPSSGNSYNNYTKSNSQNIDFKKYSYTSTRINVARRDNNVTVIRKINLGLDITEMIARQNKENYRPQDKAVDTIDENKSNTSNKSTDFEFYKQLTLTRGQGEEIKNAIIAYNKTSVSNEQVNTQDKATETIDENKPIIGNKSTDFELHKQLTLTRGQDEEVKNAIIAYNKSSVSDEQVNNDIKCVLTEKNNREICIPQQINIPSQFDSYCQQTEQRAYDFYAAADKENNLNLANNKSRKIDLSPPKEDNRVENILQRYSKILRKSDTGNLSQIPTQAKVLDKSLSNTPSKKPRRPFKITDIHNLNTPLPKKLIVTTSKRENECETAIHENYNAPHNEMEQKETTLLQVDSTEDNFSTQSNEIRNHFKNQHNINITSNEGLADNLYEPFSNYKLSETAFDNLEGPQRTDDFNIHQSMFNPKTLLQCFSKDEPDVILPPPPEFCDENENIRPKDNDNITVPMDCYEPLRWDSFYDQTKESIFQDDSHIELTPRKEIETWTLSQNDESYENLAASSSFNSTQSFTIMHNPRQRSSPFKNISVTRQSRLGQFKFCRKSKLLPKV